MTVRQLLAACETAGLRLDGSGPSLKVTPAKAIPPHLRPHLSRLHTGVRALLAGRRWWGYDAAGRGTGQLADGSLSFDLDLPPATVQVAVGGDPHGCWDRVRPRPEWPTASRRPSDRASPLPAGDASLTAGLEPAPPPARRPPAGAIPCLPTGPRGEP